MNTLRKKHIHTHIAHKHTHITLSIHIHTHTPQIFMWGRFVEVGENNQLIGPSLKGEEMK